VLPVFFAGHVRFFLMHPMTTVSPRFFGRFYGVSEPKDLSPQVGGRPYARRFAADLCGRKSRPENGLSTLRTPRC
jgi:hypothetical protein